MTGYDDYIGVKDASLIQFENVNEGRNYPFADDAVLVDESGAEFPAGVVSDMHMTVPDGCTAFLSSARVSPYMVSVCVKVVNESDGTLRSALSVCVKTDDLEPYVPYRLEPLAGSEDTGGVVSFGMVEGGPAVYRFKDGAVPVADCAVSRIVPAGVRKIVDPRTGETLSGDVKIDFSGYVVASGSAEGIGLSLEDGAADILMPDCDKDRPVNSCGATPVSSINGVSPDDKKRIVLWFH